MKKALSTNKMQSKVKSKASIKLLISISLIFLIAGVSSILFINWRMTTYAREEAKEKAMILLDRNLATHTYFTHQLKPVLFEKIENDPENKYFEPVWMSSTYAVREIDKYYHSLVKRDYYYKEAAINARSPENEADAFEKVFIKNLNKSPDLNESLDIRTINKIPYFIIMRRGETMEQNCLRCHSFPEVAPADLVRQYGPMRSFQRSVGDVVSAISIRVPLGAAYANVNGLILYLSVLLGITLLVVFGLTIYLGKRWVFDPLSFIRLKAKEISKNPENLGDQIEPPSSIELSELTSEFNEMSSQLRKERDQLETRVLERTEELKKVNFKLAKEIDEHKSTITRLEDILKEIKTLRGLLPICSYCKNIRDDKGYWREIEAYIHKYSEAKFSHSICPNCAKKYFPEMELCKDSD